MKILNALNRLIQYIKNPTRLIGLAGYNPKKKKKTTDTSKNTGYNQNWYFTSKKTTKQIPSLINLDK